MKVRSGLAFMFAVALAAPLIGAGGCARKSVQSPPPAADPSATTAPRETSSSSPVTPSPADAASAAGALTPVFFGYDSHALNDAARTSLDRIAKLLRDRPDLRLTIEGHCDERGTTEYNMSLGEQRAQAVRSYLTAAGVESGRLRTISYGKERPFDEGHGESAWASNRRAHFVVE